VAKGNILIPFALHLKSSELNSCFLPVGPTFNKNTFNKNNKLRHQNKRAYFKKIHFFFIEEPRKKKRKKKNGAVVLILVEEGVGDLIEQEESEHDLALVEEIGEGDEEVEVVVEKEVIVIETKREEKKRVQNELK
jgi:hypothetical protein